MTSFFGKESGANAEAALPRVVVVDIAIEVDIARIVGVAGVRRTRITLSRC